MVQRQRKVNPISLFWTLVLSFGIGKEASLAVLRRAYEEATGTLLSASSTYRNLSLDRKAGLRFQTLYIVVPCR